MTPMTFDDYRERGVRTPIKDGVFSLLTPEELNELKMCVIQSYAGRSGTREFIQRNYEQFAAQPVAAYRFCEAIHERCGC